MIKPTATPCQTSFAQAEYAGKKKQTRRDLFLAQMQTVVPWARLIAVIEPHYPQSGKRGRQPLGIERMLRMYLVQQWYGLADVAVEDALYDSQALREIKCCQDASITHKMPDSPLDTTDWRILCHATGLGALAPALHLRHQGQLPFGRCR